MKKLPKELYVNRCNEGTEDEYMQPNTHLKDVDCEEKRMRVGIYRLVREVEVVNENTVVTEVG